MFESRSTEIEKAENGYIVTHDDRKSVYPTFGAACAALSDIFGIKNMIVFEHSGKPIPVAAAPTPAEVRSESARNAANAHHHGNPKKKGK